MTEKIIEKDNLLKELASGAGITFAFGLIGYFLMFLFKLIAARYFGPANFGLYEAMSTILLISMVFSSFGIPAGVARFIPVYKYKGQLSLLRGYLKFIFIFPIAISILCGTAVILFSGEITAFFNFPQKFIPLLNVIGIAIPIKTLSRVLRQIFVAEKRIFFQVFSSEIIEKVILISGIAIIYVLKLSLFAAAIALLLSVCTSFVFDIIIYKTKIVLPSSKNITKETSRWLKFSIPLFLTGFFSFFIQWSDNLVIGKILTSELLGIYSIGYSLGAFQAFFKTIFISIFTPLISEKYVQGKNTEIAMLYKKGSSWGLAFSLYVLSFFLVFGKEFLSMIYGKEYIAGYPILIIISIGLIFFTAAGLNGPILILHKKTKQIFKITSITAALNLILSIILTKYIGLIGAAIASTISFTVMGIFMCIYAKKSQTDLKLDYMAYAKYIASSLITIVLGLAIKKHLSVDLYSAAMLAIILFSIYLLTSIILRAHDGDDKNLAKIIFHKIFT